MVGKFKSKVVEIEAWQFWPIDMANALDQAENEKCPQWLRSAFKGGIVWYQGGSQPYMTISTLGGEMRASPGDWIIRGAEGELHSCRDSVFQRKYEPA